METNIPARISLGVFRSNTENTFCFPLELDESAELYTDISGITVTPTAESGLNTITVATEEISDGITVYGRIYVRTSAVHEIRISGKADRNADVRRLFPLQVSVNVTQLQRGQRILLNEKTKNVKIMFASEHILVEIDGYAFMVQTDGKVSRDEDMIFWGNRSSPDDSVQLADNSLDFSVSLANLPLYVSKIAVCYSVYGNEADKTFGLVHNPYIRIFFNNVEKYNFRLDNLRLEKTVAGIEIYRYRDNWKINCIGAGYNAGLKRLCEDYGLEVID